MEYGPFDIDLSKSVASNRRRGISWLMNNFNVNKDTATEIWDYLMDNFNKKLDRMYKEWPNVN